MEAEVVCNDRNICVHALWFRSDDHSQFRPNLGPGGAWLVLLLSTSTVTESLFHLQECVHTVKVLFLRCLIIYPTVARPPCMYSMGLSCYNTCASPVSTARTPALTALSSSETSILRFANVRPFERPDDRGRNRVRP